MLVYVCVSCYTVKLSDHFPNTDLSLVFYVGTGQVAAMSTVTSVQWCPAPVIQTLHDRVDWVGIYIQRVDMILCPQLWSPPSLPSHLALISHCVSSCLFYSKWIHLMEAILNILINSITLQLEQWICTRKIWYTYINHTGAGMDQILLFNSVSF